MSHRNLVHADTASCFMWNLKIDHVKQLVCHNEILFNNNDHYCLPQGTNQKGVLNKQFEQMLHDHSNNLQLYGHNMSDSGAFATCHILGPVYFISDSCDPAS